MWTAYDKDARDEGALVGRSRWEPADWSAVSHTSTRQTSRHHHDQSAEARRRQGNGMGAAQCLGAYSYHVTDI
jgi:hypothetical protein